MKKASDRPMSVGEVRAALGLPGTWTVRRLEARGVIPPARRTPRKNERYWYAGEIPLLRSLIERRGGSAAA